MKSKLLYERALITCVLMLLVSVILKLFGVPWFNLDTSVPILNKINDIIVSKDIFTLFYSSVLLTINSYLMTNLCMSERRLTASKYMVVSFIVLTIGVYVDIYMNDVMIFIKDVVLLLICFGIRNKNFKLKEIFAILILNVLYQMISLFIRNLGYSTGFYGPCESFILNFDYYIMLVITYLYLKKGDTTICGIIHVSFSSLATKLWRKPTQNSNQCSSKEM